MKHVAMFSSGAGSAVAAKRVAEKYGTEDLILLFADVGEDEDNYRFLQESAGWIGGELIKIGGDESIWDVFRRKRFLGNSQVDLCSRILKREPMRKWLEDNYSPAETTVYMGFDWTEEHRIERAKPYWVPWTVEAPLIWEPVMDKKDALEMLAEAGIDPPLLTQQGFPHANCGGGCIKAGQKQFAHLLKVRPETYAFWEQQEQEIRDHLGKDVSILRSRHGVRAGGKIQTLTLKELRERQEAQPSFSDDADWGGCGCMTPEEDA